MVNKLCVISNYYPSDDDPYFTFVGTLVSAIADLGVDCSVITPVSLLERKHIGHTRVERTSKGNCVHVYCPKYVIYPDRTIFGFRTYRLTIASQRAAIYRAFKKSIKNCDAIYSHFLDSGINSMWLGKKLHKPAFVALGECSITYSKPSYETYGNEIVDGFNGIIYVSSALKKEVDSFGLINQNTPTIIAPNSIDADMFYVRNKEDCRAKFGAKNDDFIVAFVGGFIERKGFGLLQRVLSRHPEWKCILIGMGDIPVNLSSDQVVFSGRVSHDLIPEYLCAADVFVLPTLAEGCCNAIIEAMGCGLPIISSDRDFNNDIIDDTCSIRINPESEKDIVVLRPRLTWWMKRANRYV